MEDIESKKCRAESAHKAALRDAYFGLQSICREIAGASLNICEIEDDCVLLSRQIRKVRELLSKVNR